MKKHLKLFILSLTVLLLSGFSKTIAQTDHVGVTIAEIRKANQTKARLDSAHAQGKVLLYVYGQTRDSLRVSNDSIIFWKGRAKHWETQATKFKKQRNQWRGAALIEAALIGLGLRQKT